MRVLLNELQAQTKAEALIEISQLGASQLGLDADKLLKGFTEREAQTSTGMVEGIAIPHTMQQVADASLLVCRSSKLADWETLDGSEVELEIAIIAPAGGEEHLKLLSSVSRKLINTDNINALKAASTVDEVKEILEV